MQSLWKLVLHSVAPILLEDDADAQNQLINIYQPNPDTRYIIMDGKNSEVNPSSEREMTLLDLCLSSTVIMYFEHLHKQGDIFSKAAPMAVLESQFKELGFEVQSSKKFFKNNSLPQAACA